MTDNIKTAKEAANPDPITGSPGAHPAGVGLGAAGGAAAGAAVGTAVGGPVGTLVGGAVGAVVGGLAGKGAGEALNPTDEEAYWRENHTIQSYAVRGDYDRFKPAYRAGWEAGDKYRGRSYDDIEPELRSEWEAGPSAKDLSWDDARYASRNAYHRVGHEK